MCVTVLCVRLGLLQYFADLYHLVESLGSEEARARVQAAPCTFVNCLHTLFTATRLLSYS